MTSVLFSAIYYVMLLKKGTGVEKCALTCGVSVEGRNLYVCFFQFSLQSNVHVVHQMRE